MIWLFSDAAIVRKQLGLDVIQEQKSEAVRNKTLTSARLCDSRFFVPESYLSRGIYVVATCSPLIKGSSYVWVLSCYTYHRIIYINSQNNLPKSRISWTHEGLRSVRAQSQFYWQFYWLLVDIRASLEKEERQAPALMWDPIKYNISFISSTVTAKIITKPSLAQMKTSQYDIYPGGG